MSTATTTAPTVAATTNKVNLADVRPGDVFSESAHYVYQSASADGKNHKLKHLASGIVVDLSSKYVEDLLQTADQFQTTEEVGREDKYWTTKQLNDAKANGTLPADTTVREGDVRVKGIRSIWADIHTEKVFTVCFNKQSKDLSAKALNEAKNKQLQEAIAEIASAATAKKGVAKTAEEVIKKIQNNPVLSTEPGEERQLRGYKVTFVSTTGYYDVVDMEKENTGKNENLRKVNINEINWIVVGGVKYTVK